MPQLGKLALHTMSKTDLTAGDYKLLFLHFPHLPEQPHKQTRTAGQCRVPAAPLTAAPALYAGPAGWCLSGPRHLLWTCYGQQVRKRGCSIDNDGCHCIALQAFSQHLENFEKDKKDKKDRQTFLNSNEKEAFSFPFFFFSPGFPAVIQAEVLTANASDRPVRNC